MSLKSVAILLLLALCLSHVLAAVTTVRPYKFGFTIDEQQHRAEQRDERGIVMGEFGFITADGIYHVTVYATDEEGKFHIVSMKSYPYAGPIAPTTVAASTTTRAPPPPPAPAALPKYNFNTEACSGCFLKKSPAAGSPKTEIRTLSKPLPALATGQQGKPTTSRLEVGSLDHGVNVQLPFRQSIAQTIEVARQQGLGHSPATTTQHNTNTNSNSNSYTNTQHTSTQHTFAPTTTSPKPLQKRIEVGLDLAMTTYSTSKAAVTGHVISQTQNSKSPSSNRKVDYDVGIIRTADTVSPSSSSTVNYAKQPAGTYASQPAGTYATQPAGTYASQPAVTYASQPAGTYATQPAATYAPLNIKLNADAVRQASAFVSSVKAPLALAEQPIVPPATVPASQVPIFSVGSTGTQSSPLTSGVGHSNVPQASNVVQQTHPVAFSSPAAAAQPTAGQIFGLGAQPSTQFAQFPAPKQSTQQQQLHTPTTLTQSTQQRYPLNTPTQTGLSGAGGLSATGNAAPTKIGGSPAVVGISGGSFPKGNAGNGGATGGASAGSFPQGNAGNSGVSGAPLGGPSGGSFPKGVGGNGGLAGAPLGGGAGGRPAGSAAGGASLPAGSFPAGGSGAAGSVYRGSGPTGSASGEASGDLYKFKYILDYNGHEEAGSRNGDKEGNYFAIGEDAVRRTVEYIANEFGFQPHISWQKLDEKSVLPAENSLKHYEFKWFKAAQ
ncbi:protein lethal(3)malignant blood neoplasm 1 isoform X2 [Drosophila subobscura]|uniref:protein lethal(3)malignant blood neoplasm 1 isoform X2 n=1 Tax=Drosophila subobscura TaxID=7241 RepID=UPI00155A88AF|nr:protein lethal(3)malignant blood neoplasm 1 isoform X2 [Drosophila subobscura]